jgi:hypothetical protein
MPVVSVDTRRQILAEPVRTRFGVGDVRMDQAAGMPLRSRRRSMPVALPVPMPARPSAVQTSWDDEPNIHDVRLLHQRMQALEAPVDLPLRSRAKTYVTIAALIAAFIGVLVSVVLAGRSATTSGPSNGSTPSEVAPQPGSTPQR